MDAGKARVAEFMRRTLLLLKTLPPNQRSCVSPLGPTCVIAVDKESFCKCRARHRALLVKLKPVNESVSRWNTPPHGRDIAAAVDFDSGLR